MSPEIDYWTCHYEVTDSMITLEIITTVNSLILIKHSKNITFYLT